MEEQGFGLSSFEKYGVLLFFAFLFFFACCFNIYVLIPHFLLKNKWWTYFCSLFVVGFSILIFVIVSQTIFAKNNNGPLDPEIVSITHLFQGIINIVSSSLAFFFLLVGTSSMVLFKNWILDMRQSEELESATLQLELKLLENQINPHFLFNMLNNANIMIKKDPDEALHIIQKLEEMLRYLMNNNIQEKVLLRKEILFLTDFLELEKTRRDFFNYTVSEEGGSDDIRIHPLLFIAFVENAVKHNQDSQTASYVHILFRIEGCELTFICENSIPQKMANKQTGGIGLANMKRRLDLLYKGNYSLEQSKTDTSYTVKLKLKL